MITIVSAWYILNSKFDKIIYKKWMNHFKELVDNFYLVIYTNKESYYMLEDFIHKNVKIIIKEFDEFYGFKWEKKWIENHTKNYLLNNNSIFNTDWKLNMLWSEKINFVHESYNNNYFNTDYYIWCDIGYFREPILHKKWPNYETIKSLNKNSIYYSYVCNTNILQEYIFNILTDKFVPYEQNSISGGFFIIHKNKIDWYKKTYYDKVESFFEKNLLIKDDQYIILHCVANNIKDFLLLKDTNTTVNNSWFLFKKFLL